MFAPDKITINGQEYNINLMFLNKKNSSANIKGRVINLRISKWMSKKNKMIHIQSLLKKMVELTYKYPYQEFKFEHGRVMKIMGKDYFLNISSVNQKSSIKINNDNIFIKVSDIKNQDKIKYLLRKKLIKEYQEEVINQVKYLNQLYFNSEIKKISLKKLKARWGGCSTGKEISLAFRLLFLPEKVREYIMVHEIAHLVHMNHSKRFWKKVEFVCPEYKVYKKWLRANEFNIPNF